MSVLPERARPPFAGLLDQVGAVVEGRLAPLVRRIDQGHYPEEVLRLLGEAGAYAPHAGGRTGDGLFEAVLAMDRVAEECLATAFCVWCQDALVWYLVNTANDPLRQRLLAGAAAGRILGGTGLSNPMKAAAGIEPLRLTGRQVAGGFLVDGTLPWVSHIGPGHCFGAIFQVEGRQVMAMVDCGQPGIRLGAGARFAALDGTRTCAVVFRQAFVPFASVLADPAAPFLARIKAGFILLQTGLALGLIRGCVALMRKADARCGALNCFLPDRPDLFDEVLERLAAEIALLCRTPFELAFDYQRRVLRARLEASEWSLRAAQAAALHAGAQGFLSGAAAQRRLRESLFVAIVTPATKHLRKELAALG